MTRLMCVLLLAVAIAVAAAQENASNDQPPALRKINLPKSPVAAAYILRRLSNDELVQLERSEPVYQAILQRPGLDQNFRREALEGLAQLKGTSQAAELIEAIRRVEKGKDEDLVVLADLAVLLGATNATELASQLDSIKQLALSNSKEAIRRVGYVGWITSTQNIGEPWEAAQNDPSRLVDLLSSIALLREPTLRSQFADKLEPIARDSTRDPFVREAAVLALPYLPEHEAESFAILVELFSDDAVRNSVITALQKIPRSRWPKELAGPLAEVIVHYAASVPAAQRTDDAFLGAIQLGNDLTGLLPDEQATDVRTSLAELGVRVLVVRTIPHQIIYDRTLLYVEAGKPVSLVLENTDVMPHNLLIASPGKLEEIAVAADKMQTDPSALQRSYIPDSPLVLYATKLLQAGEKDKLFFEAPAAGDYPYLCTFPGHSRRMNGILRVVPDLDAISPEELNPASQQQFEVRPFVQAWTVADLQNDVGTMSGGRSFENARKLFQAAACVACHKIQGTGGVIGPDITDLAKTKKYTASDVLHEVIEPSHRIEDKFRPQIFQMDDGRVITGVVVQEDEQKLLVVSNPLVECEPALVVKEEIDEQFPAQISVMPTGLLNTLTREEALDLIAYVVAGGNPGHEFFK